MLERAAQRDILTRWRQEPPREARRLPVSAAGINSSGDIVGWYWDKTGEHGFLLRGGVYSSIDFPGNAQFTETWKINDTGEIAGRYIGTSDGHHILVWSNGVYTAVSDVSNSYETAKVEDGGLNNLGDIAGNYCSSKPCSPAGVGAHGFLLSNGVYTTFDYPGSISTVPFAINSAGVLADSMPIPAALLTASCARRNRAHELTERGSDLVQTLPCGFESRLQLTFVHSIGGVTHRRIPRTRSSVTWFGSAQQRA